MTYMKYLEIFKKKFIYYWYYRLMLNPKPEKRISGEKIIKELIKLYSNIDNIYELCTERELRFLEKVINEDEDIYDSKYYWEYLQLCQKMILFDNGSVIVIYKDIEKYIKEAVKNADWKYMRQKDEINSVIVGYVKVLGSCEVDSLISITSYLLSMSEDDVDEWIYNNKFISFYVLFNKKFVPELGKKLEFASYCEYFNLLDELDAARKKVQENGVSVLTPDEYKEIFYRGFNTKKESVKKLAERLETNVDFGLIMAQEIIRHALLNYDRKDLLEAAKEAVDYKLKKIKDFDKMVDAALDDMPSGALNGLTPNEYKQLVKDYVTVEKEYKNLNVKQKNAKLSEQDTILFYKLYLGLLDYTNKKYKIKPRVKIYAAKSINPKNLPDIIDALWSDIDVTIDEFIELNPFDFTKEELNLVKKFKKGKRDLFLIAKYEKDCTLILDDTHVYGVKGLVSNFDEIIPFEDLPLAALTTIVPFKDFIVYDGILNPTPMDIGIGIKKSILERLKSSKIKYKL